MFLCRHHHFQFCFRLSPTRQKKKREEGLRYASSRRTTGVHLLLISPCAKENPKHKKTLQTLYVCSLCLEDRQTCRNPMFCFNDVVFLRSRQKRVERPMLLTLSIIAIYNWSFTFIRSSSTSFSCFLALFFLLFHFSKRKRKEELIEGENFKVGTFLPDISKWAHLGFT